MHNLLMNIRRYKALIMAIIPYPIVAALCYGVEASDGFASVGYLIVLIVSVPVFAGVSVLSVIFAFNGKDPERKWIRTTKVLSIISMTVFVGACLTGLVGVITSMF